MLIGFKKNEHYITHERERERLLAIHFGHELFGWELTVEYMAYIYIHMFIYVIYIHVNICRFACGGRFASRILFPMGLESVHEVGSNIAVAQNGSWKNRHQKSCHIHDFAKPCKTIGVLLNYVYKFTHVLSENHLLYLTEVTIYIYIYMQLFFHQRLHS